MAPDYLSQLPDTNPEETTEWLESLESVVHAGTRDRTAYLLRTIVQRARHLGIDLPVGVQTPYINSVPAEDEPDLPLNADLEKRIRRLIRWNAMAMVHRANERIEGLGGHLSTYASSASLYEVGFNHFFRGPDAPGGGDQLFIQGHAASGIYARAFLEGRLTEQDLDHFRTETAGHGLPSYPHPWLMPDFWQFPTVSMGLGPIAAIYQARFNRYLEDRGLKETSGQRVWCFLGDGETDEPESLGSLSIAAREQLDNLTFIVNCNLQRLDGPVRGNGKIIQELEAVFRGAGWNVIKVVWGPEWDPLLARDDDGLLVGRMNQVTDGEFQKYSVETGAYIRKHFFGSDPRLLALVSDLDDRDLKKLRRGGHSFRKIYTAFRTATEHRGQPTVILAKTVKGWTLGKRFAGRNVAHQLKHLDEEQLRKFRDVLDLPIPDRRIDEAPYYNPGPDSEEVRYLIERRRQLGGPLPSRKRRGGSVSIPAPEIFKEFRAKGRGKVKVSTTIAFTRLLRTLLRDKKIGQRVVPIIPDEARTFGMDSLFKEVGIYSSLGQLYDPVDSDLLLNYREATDGQLLEEGITEAGSMASFIAASTSYATHGVAMIPFYVFYSMFGLQRTGDQVWSLGDSRGRGFMMAATAGRTTLNGEGLQHQDGHSHLMAAAVPNLMAYDPAYAYELSVIIYDGLERMIQNQEDIFYYITIYNENYSMPPMPEGSQEGILKGMYLLSPAETGQESVAQLFGSGPVLRCSLSAQKILAEKFAIHTDVWSVTSYQELSRDARRVERRNRMNPTAPRDVPYVGRMLESHAGPVIASSDWVAALPGMIQPYLSRRFVALGTDGYGRSDTRDALRSHFEVDARWIAYTTLHALMLEDRVPPDTVQNALKVLDLDPEKPDPLEV